MNVLKGAWKTNLTVRPERDWEKLKVEQFLIKVKMNSNFQVIWLTGQPASGKTTLANLLIESLSNEKPNKLYFNIDGDDLRNLFQNKDYSRKGRESNIRLGMSLAAYLINKNVFQLFL